MKSINVAVVGATGLVGSTVLSILEERKFPINKLYLLASAKSAGEVCEFKGKSFYIENLETFDFKKTQLAFFCVSNELAAQYAPKATAEGNFVIDKSSNFRYQPDIPLVIPEVNSDALKQLTSSQKIIANPNCSTIPIVMAIKPIYDAVGITRMNVATYQSVSGSGKEALEELADQAAKLLSGKPIKPKIYPQQIAFNVLPHCDDFQENGYTKEEMKIIWEAQKILNDPNLLINPTAVRVPVFYGHSAAVHLETQEKIDVQKVIKLLSKAPGVKVVDHNKQPYATPVKNAAGNDFVYVGRIREDLSSQKGLNLWVVTDNVRKGAALNAIQVAEKILSEYL